jgi:photosynthetic reaction center cytochrome c subunit
MRLISAQVLACTVSLISGAVLWSTAQTEPRSCVSPATKTAEQVYKNIQVLKEVPAEQLIPAMQLITASLGVQCDFCHVENAFEKDDKQPKQTARKMILMMLALNRDNFQGQRKVTCYACHRGTRKPLNVPIIDDENRISPEMESHPRPPAPGLPTLDSILEMYLRAMGGPQATAKVSTRIQHGTLNVGEKGYPVDVLSESPDRRLTIVHFADGDHVTALGVDGGWSSTPGVPVHNMGTTELQDARLEAELFFAANLRTVFGELKPLGTARINGKEVFLATGSRNNSSPVQLYFDTETGLLQRMTYYTETPLGTNPMQVDYADYREQDGVKTPFQWTVSRPNRRFTIRIEKTQQNVPINDSRLRGNLNGPSQ